jgi:two-component system, chemotaxis family, CheB/CheR fusion protein
MSSPREPAVQTARAPHVSASKPPRGTAREPVELIVVIGASAGGLAASRALLKTLPTRANTAYILVQHLDPSHDSLMVGLLQRHTTMSVVEATHGGELKADTLYVITPNTDLTVHQGALVVTSAKGRHGARHPIDDLLRSLAEDAPRLTVALILTGTGADGTLGAGLLRKAGGFVIAQAPGDAEYPGMPRHAISAGAVDLVLSLAQMPAALEERRVALRATAPEAPVSAADPSRAQMAIVIDLLRTRTHHDFKHYKLGTLQRRLERRYRLISPEGNNVSAYVELLQSNNAELEALAKDLLIHVTSFFRDPTVFDTLATTILPELIASHSIDQPFRLWVAGCSTGEEAYSLAIVVKEVMATLQRALKLQVFASDVDPDAIATAREGSYPRSIEADVSPERLARFFTLNDDRYMINAEVREDVVFTVQDILSDPPFSKIDFISCRNLLIYLSTDAQTKLTSLFHFALRPQGILLLGASEVLGSATDRFDLISKPERLYRHVGHRRPGDLGFALGRFDTRPRGASTGAPRVTRQAALADVCRKLVLDAFAPAAVLVDRKYQCLYFFGPTSRYLSVAAGPPTHDILAMVRDDVRIKLRAALQQVATGQPHAVVAGGQTQADGGGAHFVIDVRTVEHEGEDLLLVCFVDRPPPAARDIDPVAAGQSARTAELELELKVMRAELQATIQNLETSAEEQRAINEEATSVTEEYQATNEELLTSKEELQSLNEELTALNTQLQETLDRQRTTFNDLQNVLYSTDVATVFLDTQLNIRFFTPATRLLFSVIASDIGRPLADIASFATDRDMSADAQTVLRTLTPIEREIEGASSAWFIRRILPYRTHDDGVEGVVITFTDISERKSTAKALETARQQSELANIAKSRFLAAASHDLRQPLQTLSLLQGLLASTVEGERSRKLVARLDETLGAMSGILNTLLDINQIEAGTVRAEPISFRIGDLLDRMRDEFTYHAQARKLGFKVVPCSLVIHSDPRLLEQILRNLLSNAMKYTRTGRVLLGVRRRKGILSLEVWDTGVGIPASELETIFEEYHQLDNAARGRNAGLGLGLAIVRRLGDLLGHQIRVRSRLGKGSAFAIEVILAATAAPVTPARPVKPPPFAPARRANRGKGHILVVEDDADVRELLELLLTDEGYRVDTAIDGQSALERVAQDGFVPDLLLVDYNLPGGLNGIEVTQHLRERLGQPIPMIVLTGDISTDTLRHIAKEDCLQLNKPVKIHELTGAIQSLLMSPPSLDRAPHPTATRTTGPNIPLVYIVDDDALICQTIRAVVVGHGHAVETFGSAEAFLRAQRTTRLACLLVDAYLPGLSGLDLIERLAAQNDRLPTIMITGHSDVNMAVRAMKAGAIDFIEKPIATAGLLASIDRALGLARDTSRAQDLRADAARHLADLTTRQREVLDLVLAGHPSKNIAADLGISQRTVENHRAAIMKKMGTKSLPALARVAMAAGEE